MKHYTITFANSDKPALVLPEGAMLSEHLDAINSPILFGCREGICGTCLCEVSCQGLLPASSEHEREALAIYAPNNPSARLACQLTLHSDITLKKITEYA